MEHLNSNLDELLEVKRITNDVEKGITETKLCIGKRGLMRYELKYIAQAYERKKKEKMITNPENVFKKIFPRR